MPQLSGSCCELPKGTSARHTVTGMMDTPGDGEKRGRAEEKGRQERRHPGEQHRQSHRKQRGRLCWFPAQAEEGQHG